MVVRDVLDLGTGSIVEVDKAAGEPVDVMVNGRLVAKGEVVVIEDNFGVRITEILNPAERFRMDAA
jgi:flagellar motor switch protein FliN/FliY